MEGVVAKWVSFFTQVYSIPQRIHGADDFQMIHSATSARPTAFTPSTIWCTHHGYTLFMRALEIAKQATPVAPNVHFVTNRSTPEPLAGEVQIQTEVSALNHLDLWVGRGMPGIDTKWPTVGGSDGVGKVVKLGEGVDSAWLGRRVILMAAISKAAVNTPNHNPAGEDIHMIGEHSPGTHAEFFTAPVTNILDIAQHDPAEAAAIGLTHLTAYRMLLTRARVTPGAQVLITGIGGGVAVAATLEGRRRSAKE